MTTIEQTLLVITFQRRKKRKLIEGKLKKYDRRIMMSFSFKRGSSDLTVLIVKSLVF